LPLNFILPLIKGTLINDNESIPSLEEIFKNMEINKENKIELNNGEKFFFISNKEGYHGY
jgi:hypothetical protein